MNDHDIMTTSQNKTDELEELHREASELRNKPKVRRPAKPSRDALTAEDATPSVWKEIEDAVSELHYAADEIESAASEHPVLALLTAFACGVVVGQLMTRKS